jgi:IS5 family transposase
MKVTIRRVLTNVRRHARSLLPPNKDIRKTGRKGFRKHALVAALVLGFLRGIVTERGMERYLNEHRMEARLCDLQAKPSDTTIGRVKRWLEPGMVEQLLNIAIKETIKHLGKRRVCIAVDCSPLEAYREKDCDASWGYSTTKGWFFGYKIHAAIDAVTGLPLAVIVTSGNRHGMNYLPVLLQNVRKNGIRFRVVIADSGYDGEANYRAIKDFKAIPVIKRNKRNTKDGSTAREDSLRNNAKMGYESETWKMYYSMRTSAERFFSLIKDTLKLEQHRMKGLQSVTIWTLLVMLAVLMFVLTALSLGLTEHMLKVGTFVYR